MMGESSRKGSFRIRSAEYQVPRRFKPTTLALTEWISSAATRERPDKAFRLIRAQREREEERHGHSGREKAAGLRTPGDFA